ncbi:GIY-YIG nuclease family protein [Methylovirgula sp. HY1]|uniref:GIY-YIG nuclease family protein n=1 Tax=Methylovirgula sp. HY1 TaxID=2822761 RepID=UPI001C5B4B86|nr:GIY-YIG nuclease family protein [Methylovirgula sp. HY1]QXX74610.1 hypothetical protein MHY1_01425 [Methylovirgula sp. HY1]
MLIYNYGLFWRKDWIHWGRGSNAGHLNGMKAGAKTSIPVDFRDQQGVYCLYDESFKLVYVGQAGGKNDQRLFQRLKQHREDAVSERWSRFSWFGIRQVLQSGLLKAEKYTAHPDVGDVLNHIEAILIAAAEPVQNRQGGKFGDHVEQYLQYRDIENVGPDTKDMIRELWASSKK